MIKSVKNKLLAGFLFFAIFPILLLGGIAYINFETALKKQVVSNLGAIAENKATLIQQIFEEKVKQIETVTLSPQIKSLLDSMESVNSLTSASTIENVELEFLRKIKTKMNFKDLCLVSSEGRVLLHTDTNYELGKIVDDRSSMDKVFENSKKKSNYVSGYKYNSVTKKTTLAIVFPILNKNKINGTIVAHFGIEKLVELGTKKIELGQTGEVIIAFTSKDSLHYITSHKQQRKRNTQNCPLQKAIAGEKVLTSYWDYRGVKVLSAYRVLPDLNIGIVVKIDKREALAPLYEQRWLFLITLISVILIVLFATSFSYSISRPITELTRVSDEMGNGNLSIRTKIVEEGEIGKLGKSFNTMAQNTQDLLQELKAIMYSASHDLQAPLKTISGLATMLEDELEELEQEEVIDMIQRIQKNSDKLSQLIIDLIDVNRSDQNDFIQEPVDFENIVLGISEQLKEIKDKNNVSMSFTFTHEAPFLSHSLRFSQILSNLISNGIKYSDPQKMKRYVHVHTEVLSEFEFLLEVSDNGRGIPMESREKMFTMFYRAHTDVAFGSGLGLYLVKKHVNNLNGSMTFKSSELGTVFTMIFPIVKEEEQLKKESVKKA